MKKIITLAIIVLPFIGSSQNWLTAGNTGAAGQWLGTNNSFPLTFKTNNTERGSFSSSGVFKLNALSGTGNGLMLVNSTGEVSRLGFGGANQVCWAQAHGPIFSAWWAGA